MVKPLVQCLARSGYSPNILNIVVVIFIINEQLASLFPDHHKYISFVGLLEQIAINWMV